MIDSGIDLEETDPAGWTVLGYACRCMRVRMRAFVRVMSARLSLAVPASAYEQVAKPGSSASSYKRTYICGRVPERVSACVAG